MSDATGSTGTPLRGSPACERNADAIGEVLADWLDSGDRLLEIGSGTGQHAAYLIDRLSGVIWQPSDRQVDDETIGAWSATAVSRERILAPLRLDVTNAQDWQRLGAFDAVFSANTLHIMPWPSVVACFAGLGEVCPPATKVMIYGPFHRQGKPTSDSNARFDAELRAAGTGMGIRSLEAVQSLAAANGLLQLAHYQMPANNQLLVWRRGES